ncbi:MAG: hypothetical protein FJY66_03335, partial [Calditrichaeota bacterium]|nr:hypothetical protein [Calditrichota bacterium]
MLCDGKSEAKPMKFRAVLLAALLAGFCMTGNAAWLAVNSPISDQVPAVEIRSGDAASWQVNVTVAGYTLESFTENGQTYQRIYVPDEMMAGDDGEAELPLLSRFLALRTDGDPELEVVSEEWMDLEGTFELAPNMEEEHSQVLAPGYAMQDTYLPEVSYETTPRKIMGGVSLTTISIHPAKYNPLQKRLRVLKSVELRVHEQGAPLSYDRPITETTASILRAMVPNWDEVSLDIEIVRGTLLYIVANNTTVESAIQGLVTWRTRKGYKVEVAGPNQIGSMSLSTIKSYIQGRYYSANPPLEFVCLVGDANGTFLIPAYSNGY